MPTTSAQARPGRARTRPARAAGSAGAAGGGGGGGAAPPAAPGPPGGRPPPRPPRGDERAELPRTVEALLELGEGLLERLGGARDERRPRHGRAALARHGLDRLLRLVREDAGQLDGVLGERHGPDRHPGVEDHRPIAAPRPGAPLGAGPGAPAARGRGPRPRRPTSGWSSPCGPWTSACSRTGPRAGRAPRTAPPSRPAPACTPRAGPSTRGPR